MTLGIVTISYNQARFLAEAIESVRLDDPARLRYVIVDAGSTDGSREIIQRHAQRFHRIICEPDRGPADGLNKGFADLDADVYGYLNSDDRFAPGALDYVLGWFAARPKVDVLLGGCRVIDAAGRPQWRQRMPGPFSLTRYLCRATSVIQQGTFFRQRAWKLTRGFNQDNRTCWDWELVADMALGGARFGVVYRALGDFRLHDQSISGAGWLTQEYLRDEERIRWKVLKRMAGRAPGPLTAALARFWFRAHPWRRLRELMGR